MMNEFNPAIDRYDSRSAARIFRYLWPDKAVSRAIVQHLARSIEVAHESGEANWGVTLFPQRLRLNVGQVETLTLYQDGAWFFFRAPLELPPLDGVSVEVGEEPVFPSVPVPSGRCFVPAKQMSNVPTALREAHDARMFAQLDY